MVVPNLNFASGTNIGMDDLSPFISQGFTGGIK